MWRLFLCLKILKANVFHLKKSIELPLHLAHINKIAAGIDVGSSTHFVAVTLGCNEVNIREFSSFTINLHALAD